MNLNLILNLGTFLDKLPDWWGILFMIFFGLYYVQILMGLFLMGNHFDYPKIKINDKVDEWSQLIGIPFRLYYIMFFTDKLDKKK